MNSRPSLTKALAIETTTFPSSGPASGPTVATAASHGVATTTSSQAAVTSFDSPLITSLCVGQASSRLSATPCAAVGIPRADDRFVAGRRKAERESAPRRSRSTEDPDAHDLYPCTTIPYGRDARR